MPLNVTRFGDNAKFGGPGMARNLFRGPIIDTLAIAVGASATITGPCELRMVATEALKIDVKRGTSGADANNSFCTFVANQELPLYLDAGDWNIDVK